MHYGVCRQFDNNRRAAGFLAIPFVLVALIVPLTWARAEGKPGITSPNTYQLLANSGMEAYDAPYAGYEGVPAQVATAWQRFWYDGPAPYWMDTRVFADSHLGAGWVERIQGETSQLLISTEPYSAGLWQRVSGLTSGTGYGFHAALLTIYQTSAPPAVDGTMVKQVGIDPTGGTDPRAATVVWSEPDDHDEGPWDIDQRTAAWAQGEAVTVFVRVVSPYGSGGLPYLNYSFLDSAILAQTPTVAASSPPISEDLQFAVRWDNAQPAPGGGQLKWRDVQWLDEAEGVWHDWFVKTYAVEATFTGERGHTYRFRARAWQKYPNGAHLYSPYRLQGDTTTVVAGPTLAGRVLDPEEQAVPGVTVAILETGYEATTDLGGRFVLRMPPASGPWTVSVSHPWWASPAPVYGVTVGLTDTVPLTWTLRPPDDAVVNGGFEQGAAGWSLLGDPGNAPSVVDDPVHTGRRALSLPVAPSDGVQDILSPEAAAAVSQRVTLSGAWDPVLSFWYRSVEEDADGARPTRQSARFNVLLTLVAPDPGSGLPVTTTHVLTPDLDAGGWQHAWYRPSPPRTLWSGLLDMQFRLSSLDDGPPTTVYLDEVSWGRSPGGPWTAYLPLLHRRR